MLRVILIITLALGWFGKLWTAVYPPRMAPIGAKLCQNAFQTIPDIWFFDALKIFSMKFLDRKWSIKSKIVRFGGATNFWALPSNSPRKITPFPPNFKSLRSLARGSKDSWSFFFVDFGPNLTYNFCSMDRMMVWWYDDMMIWITLAGRVIMKLSECDVS